MSSLSSVNILVGETIVLRNQALAVLLRTASAVLDSGLLPQLNRTR
jgi:hypothetical protein